jgi:antibiotic biosynthesis monooxygenase (ABM) superfamily enzyme
MVRNANKLEKLVKKKEGLQNWLDYYENKQARHPELVQTTKVIVSSCIYPLENEFKWFFPSVSDMFPCG